MPQIYRPVYAIWQPGVAWTFPLVYVFNFDWEVEFLNLVPGRGIDGASSLSPFLGMRVYAGSYGNDGWYSPASTNKPDLRAADIVWTQCGDQRQSIPWGGKVQGAIQIFAVSGVPVNPSASVEFTIQGYSE